MTHALHAVCFRFCFQMFFPVNPLHFQESMNGWTGFRHPDKHCISFGWEHKRKGSCFFLICKHIISIIPSVSTPPLLFEPTPIFLCRRLERAAASASDQVKGVCDGGGGEGQESHDLCAPAGGSLQHTTGLLPPAKARRGLQSGSRWPHWVSKHFLEILLSCCRSLLVRVKLRLKLLSFVLVLRVQKC